MADSDEAISLVVLKELQESISRLFINFKKTSQSRYSQSYLETRKDLLEDYFSQARKEQRNLLAQSDLSKQDKAHIIEIYDQIEECYLEFKTILKEKLQIYLKQEKANTSSQSSCAVTKLPKINIPTFSGNYRDWSYFKDMFTSLVEDDTTLSDIQKHHYLRTSLKGEADQLVRHFDITAANYSHAWKCLINRYSNPRIIVNTILNRLLNQRKLSKECAKGLKELLDTTNECLNSLSNFEIDTTSWDPLIVHLLISKLDIETHKGWEQSLGSTTELPTYQKLASYLEGRFRAVEIIQSNYKKDITSQPIAHPSRVKNIKSFTTELNTECTFCTKNHYICHCTTFSQLNVEQRRDFVKKNNLCFNCLVKGHSIKNCRQNTRCRICTKRHHTLLHQKVIVAKPIVEPELENKTTTQSESEVTTMNVSVGNNLVILGTARVGIKNRNGEITYLRALVDQGSMATFITESAVQLLGLPKTQFEVQVTGIGNNAVKSQNTVLLDIYSPIDSQHVMQINAHILTKLTTSLPTRQFNADKWLGLTSISLADPHFNRPGHIDLLLGADAYATILQEGLHKHESLIAQNTKLGWLISGSTKTANELPEHHITVSTSLIEVDNLLRKFWEIEETSPKKKPLTILEKKCEDHYKETHTRKQDGRYEVRLPFKDQNSPNLGDSKPLALRRLLQMEKKFLNNPEFKKRYCEFLRQYESQGHMELISEESLPEKEEKNEKNDKDIKPKKYYLPHHAVLRESSVSTKLRVVFDGSAQPAQGNSINEELMIGPPLQQDLKDLVTRWRRHKICLVADVQNMYRQILITNKDTDYQRILWREDPKDMIQEYRLRTVTYGTSCAPYLAIKTLHQLAEDESQNFPDESQILKTDVYMDDLLTGTSSDENAIKMQTRLTSLFARGGFPLHKWTSNSNLVLDQIPQTLQLSQNSINIKLEESVKALGVTWKPQLDVFELKVLVDCKLESTFTKRTALSVIAKTFDPLGWLAPIIILLKIFMQKLWQAGLNWDDELPIELNLEWQNYLSYLSTMKCIQLPRWLGISDTTTKVELHGFCDASCSAYAGVVYLRVVEGNKIKVNLIVARTKVAPVKLISVPRLELCGALLLSSMLKNVRTSLNIPNHCVFAWTDSTIVLAWLRKSPNTWKTFIANRTTEILNTLNSNQWHHIPSQHNPADCASRGMTPEELENHELWWNGPDFLRDSINIRYTNCNIPEVTLERKVQHVEVVATPITETYSESLLKRYSNLNKLVRVIAYILRFVQNCKDKVNSRKAHIDTYSYPQYLTVVELRNARHICIRISQELAFPKEIEILRNQGVIHNSSILKQLVPFLDSDNILRVTGRLHNASISAERRTPIILSAKCNFTSLIVQEAHLHALHGGPQLTLNILSYKYWIIGAKNLVKKVIRKCLTCYKHSCSPLPQLMGQLPSARVRPGKPFRCSGVDYAGPVILKLYPGRCQRTSKAYICLFVCTATKAIHLELVSDYSTNAFLASFRRFTSRRGYCSDLWSDCATNFVGASKELDCMFKNRKSKVVGEIAELLANDNTTWHFIPPGSPHFGGLWEAGVKSVKAHLKRVIGEARLTFEEYSTLLVQVEACVNSRPLTLPSSSLDDISPITPGHFLIGEAPITVPEDNLEEVSLSPLNRWQLMQRMLHTLWSRWSTEYLCTLQNRYKWSTKSAEPDIGTVVLVKDERLPPGKWLLGKIVKKHPGKDGLTRVVTLKMKGHLFQRPITKICPLNLQRDSA